MSLLYINSTHPTTGYEGFHVSQKAFNIYPKTNKNSGEVLWHATPGWREKLELGKKQPRGSIVFKGKLYTILDSALYQVKPNDNITVVGTLRTRTGRCHLAEDGINMMVSDGNFMYRFDGVNWFTMSVPFTYPTHVTYHEGYFFAVEGGTGRVFRSNQFDGSTWEALDFFTAEDKSDNVLALASSNMLWVIGEWTAQPYMHRSSTTAPFYPYQQGRQYYGIIGDTVSVLAGDVVWLARTRDGKATVVIVPKNGELQPMMDDYINTEISQLTTIDDAYSNTLTWQGQNWYILTFPTERRTFVYTGTAWIEWGDFDEQLSRMVEHPMVDAQYFEGVNYFFDDDGILMELRHDVYAHGDNHRICWAESRVYEETGQRVFIHLWELQAATAQGGDATIQLSCSLDGGRTWGNWHPYDMGRDAEWDTRIRWHRLGSGYKFVLRWRISDAVDFSIGPSIINASVKTSLLERRNTRPGGDKWMT